ncbi:MAG: hypothetical protein LBG07_07600, partial [Treponema sp.]|nr:hypothetical protein [Treponema sp.]
SPKKFLTLESVDGGTLEFTGATTKFLTIGGGGIETNDTLVLSTSGYVVLEDVTLRVPKEYGATFNATGPTLKQVIIDLTDSGKIIIEPGAKLNLAAGGTGALDNAGVITTVNGANSGNKGVAGGKLIPGDLTPSTVDATPGKIPASSGNIEIDSGDTFGGSGDNVTVTPGP